MSLVYDKSDQHQTIYDIYDAESGWRFIQALTLEIVSTTYSLSRQLEYNISNEDGKHWFYEVSVAYYCNGCNMTPLTQYKNNKIEQELTKENNFFSSKFDESLYIDMRKSKRCTNELEKLTHNERGVRLSLKLKVAATKKMTLRIAAYSQSEYWYANTNKGYIMTYKDYNLAKDDVITA